MTDITFPSGLLVSGLIDSPDLPSRMGLRIQEITRSQFDSHYTWSQ